MTSEVAQRKVGLAQRLRTLSAYPTGRFAGFGIVICAGGPLFFTNAFVLIHFLRHSLRCTLPIEVWYFGTQEMSPRMISMLRELDVRAVDANSELTARGLSLVDGWQLKPFAMMWCRFQHALLLDADQVPTRDPRDLLEWPQYKATGAIVWPDLMDLAEENPIWDACGLEPRTVPALESGQFFIDKARHWKALEIAFYLNEHADFYYRMVYGDKDTYLLGLLLAGAGFTLVPHRPINDRGLCLYQHDFQGQILFQHRTGAKWRYGGAPDKLPGFVGYEACLDALKSLRRGWNGLVVPAPTNNSKAREAEQKLCERGALVFLVAGEQPVRLEILGEGEIGEGRSATRMNWHCEENLGAIDLVIKDAFAPCWRLRQQSNGRWYGNSVSNPDVEAYAAFDSDTDVFKLMQMPRVVRSPWPMRGRYSDKCDI